MADVAGWFRAAGKYDWSQEKQDENALRAAITRAFFRFNAKQDWIYRGKGVKLGDSKEPVFWTRGKHGKCRVIYGDLSIREADEKELP